MKLIIEIPNLTYIDCLSGACDTDVLIDAVANGTPLPKGHGDLIDRNEARDAMRYTMSGTGYQSMAMDVLNEFYTPTVIEADEEASDG